MPASSPLHRHVALMAAGCLWLAPLGAPAQPNEPPSVSAQERAPDAAAEPASRAAEPDLSELGDPRLEEPQESMGWTLARTLLVLGAVLAAIYLTLNVGLRRLMGLKAVGGAAPGLISVLERAQLDQRRALFVVKAAGEYLLVGSGEGGLTLLTKLDTAEVERLRTERPSTQFAASPFLQKLLSRKGGSPPPTA